MIQFTEDEIKAAITALGRKIRIHRELILEAYCEPSRENWSLQIEQFEKRIAELKSMLGSQNETGLDPITIEQDVE